MAAKKDENLPAPREIDLTSLADMGNEELVNYLQNQGVEVYDVSDVERFLGDGFVYVEKSELVNVPFLILDVRTGMSPNFTAPYATIRAKTGSGKPVKFVDFSTGVLDMLLSLEKSGKNPVGMWCSKGLTVSEYDACQQCGHAVSGCQCDVPGPKAKATTYYLGL